MDRVDVEAPGKVNLRLVVLAREASGYHSLETLFCGIGLADRVQIERGPAGVRLQVEGDVDTGPPERNLAARAAEEFFDRAGVSGGATIRLEKQIPAAAGLGGGSSDAAATLRGLNRLFDQPLSTAKLVEIGAGLGSDVPFFLTSTPYALGWGRGERLLALPPLPPRPVVVVHPGESMKTSTAFARLAELRGPDYQPDAASIPLDAISTWDGVRQLARNDFELSAFERLARLPNVTRALLETGADFALLAGSGASVFGVFGTEDAAVDAADSIRSLGLTAWRTHTLSHWPEPVPRD